MSEPTYDFDTCTLCHKRVMRRTDGDGHGQAAWGIALEGGGVYGATNCPARANESGTDAVPHKVATFDVQGDYGQGWEVVTAGTKAEATANLREYRENEPGIPFRIRRAKDES